MTRMAMPIPPPPMASPPVPPTRLPRTSLTWPGLSFGPLRKRTRRVLPGFAERATLETLQEAPELVRARHGHIGGRGQLRGPFMRFDRDADGMLEACVRKAL